jgi:hypothetical protein
VYSIGPVPAPGPHWKMGCFSPSLPSSVGKKIQLLPLGPVSSMCIGVKGPGPTVISTVSAGGKAPPLGAVAPAPPDAAASPAAPAVAPAVDVLAPAAPAPAAAVTAVPPPAPPDVATVPLAPVFLLSGGVVLVMPPMAAARAPPVWPAVARPELPPSAADDGALG